jgi:hypothetical protein
MYLSLCLCLYLYLQVGHWLDQGHTWNQVGWPRMQRTQVCAAAADLSNYTTYGLAHDGCRDTPPQAAARFRQAVYLPCDSKTGLVPDPGTWRNDSQTCVNATGFPRGDGFYSNFYNVMVSVWCSMYPCFKDIHTARASSSAVLRLQRHVLPLVHAMLNLLLHRHQQEEQFLLQGILSCTIAVTMAGSGPYVHQL